MRKIVLFCLLVILVAAVFTSCKKESHFPDNAKTIVLPPNGASVINANNHFAFDFLHETLLQDVNDNNKLISPLSIYLALSMAYNGAATATKDSMIKVLQLSGIDINDLNAVCNALITQLPGEDNKVQFSIANSIWYNKNYFQPLTPFLNVVQDQYEASIQSLDFNDPSSAKAINDWVSGKTNNKISKIIGKTSPDDLMYLINAIYFNGAWQYKFSAANTQSENFFLQDGSIKPVPFMEQKVTVNYYADTLFTLIELPYGSGKSYSMYIALPNKQQQPVSTFASLIDENILANAIGKMHAFNMQLDLPKWEYSYEIDDMRPGLAMLGMNIAFNEGADFSGMYDPGQVKPFITKAVHKTYIKVNEEGTEAAAVTGIGAGTTVCPYLIFLKLIILFYIQ